MVESSLKKIGTSFSVQLPRFILKPKKKIRSTLLKNIEKTPTLNKKDYIERQAIKLIRKYNTRNPFELAYALNINVRFYDFNKLKGFYNTTSEIDT